VTHRNSKCFQGNRERERKSEREKMFDEVLVNADIRE